MTQSVTQNMTQSLEGIPLPFKIDVDKIAETLSLYGLEILGALAIFIIGRWVVRLAIRMLKRVMIAGKVDETLVSFTGNVLYALGLTFVVIAALSQMGVQTMSLAAVIGAAGLAIGLALQGSLANLASGVMIIGLRPFKIGDRIEAAGKAGVVTNIDIFTTSLRTDNNLKVIIPNGKITSDIITNHTA